VLCRWRAVVVLRSLKSSCKQLPQPDPTSRWSALVAIWRRQVMQVANDYEKEGFTASVGTWKLIMPMQATDGALPRNPGL